jgi:hypothetical protein
VAVGAPVRSGLAPAARGSPSSQLTVLRATAPVYCRAARLSRCTVLATQLLPDKVLGVSLDRSKGFAYQAGQYVRVRVPQISFYEWHPFTLSSGEARGATSAAKNSHAALVSCSVAVVCQQRQHTVFRPRAPFSPW